MPTFPHPEDLEVLRLELGADVLRSTFELVPRLARHDGGLYGGTATAVSIAAMELATQRPALSVTTHFVATASLGDVIVCTTTVLALGGRIAQLEVVGRSGDAVFFVSLGCTATPREDGLTGQYESMPDVTGPEEAAAVSFQLPRFDDFRGFTEQVELRPASRLDGEEMHGVLMWARLVDNERVTPAGIAFLADVVPLAIARTARRIGGGTSIDNSLRFGDVSATEGWVLLEAVGHMSAGSHAIGSVNVWSERGDLLAVGSQATNMRYIVSQADAAAFEGFGPIPG